MRRRFGGGVELTERQFLAQPWVFGSLTYDREVLYIKDGPVHGNPQPFGMLYRPMLKACFSDAISFSGIELHGKVWGAQVWYCETFDTGPPAGAVKNADGTLREGKR